MDGVLNLGTSSIHFSSQLYTQLAATLVPFPIANFVNGVLGYPTDKSVCHWASPDIDCLDLLNGISDRCEYLNLEDNRGSNKPF